MTTAEATKVTLSAGTEGVAAASDTSEARKPDAADSVEMITLDHLAREMNVSHRDARMLLRLAAKQAKLYPTLGKEHVARQPWAWKPGSKALAEAKKALAASTDAG